MLKFDSVDILPYFYWTSAYIERVGKLTFTYYSLDPYHKDAINKAGEIILNKDGNGIAFEIDKLSHRHDINIKNIAKLFDGSNKDGQKERYEYIKEYVLWKIMCDLRLLIGKELREIQKRNFLYTYLKYIFRNKEDILDNDILDKYEQYSPTVDGKAEPADIKKLRDSQHNKELSYRINRLYVLKEESSKLHFIYSNRKDSDKEELRKLLDIMGRDDTGNLFRGQASSFWKLESSLHRDPKFIEEESRMYYEILTLKPDAFANDKSVYERLITMQHFGMPTRLMDVTRNPLVAIFFACNNLGEAKNDGVVYTFSDDGKSLNYEDPALKKLHDIHNKENVIRNKDHILRKISFVRGVAKNQRISSQCGDFILLGDIENKKEIRELPKSIIIIDAYTKGILLEQLESLNMHGGAVYPDLTHMSNYIKNKFSKKNQNNVSITNLNDDDKFILNGYKDSGTIIEESMQAVSNKVADLTSSMQKITAPLTELSSQFDTMRKIGINNPFLTALSGNSNNQIVPSIVENLTSNSIANIWNNSTLNQLSEIANKFNLNIDKTKVLVENMVAFNQPPTSSSIHSISIKKHSLKEWTNQRIEIMKALDDFANKIRDN